MISAIGEFVLIVRDKNPEVSDGGIQLLSTDEPSNVFGRVLSVGHLISDVAIDDRVIFPRYAGTEILINQECFLILHGNDILATVDT